MEDLRLDLVDGENRAEWRRRTRVAHTSPEGSTVWRREIEMADQCTSYASDTDLGGCMRKALWIAWVLYAFPAVQPVVLKCGMYMTDDCYSSNDWWDWLFRLWRLWNSTQRQSLDRRWRQPLRTRNVFTWYASMPPAAWLRSLFLFFTFVVSSVLFLLPWRFLFFAWLVGYSVRNCSYVRILAILLGLVTWWVVL